MSYSHIYNMLLQDQHLSLKGDTKKLVNVQIWIIRL